MRISIDLENPLVFQQVDVPKPTDLEVSVAFYNKAKRVLSCSTQVEKRKFIAQWNRIINCFNKILIQEINCDLKTRTPYKYYRFFIDLLKKGITDSILWPGEGLLSQQNEDEDDNVDSQGEVFVQLKIFLESICVYCIHNPGSPRIHSLLLNLYKNIDVCGPGLFTHFQQAFHELYIPHDNLFSWLANFRGITLKKNVETFCADQSITGIVVSHVYTAFSAYAKKMKWHLLDENGVLKDDYIRMVIPDKDASKIYAKLDKDFKHYYETEAVDHLAERLTVFITDHFARCAETQTRAKKPVLSSKNQKKFDSFFEALSPVLDSFCLQMNFFLIDVSNSRYEHVRYCLNEAALKEMKYYVAVGLSHLKMLNAGPLTLLIEMSTRLNDPTVCRYFIDSISPNIWHVKFKQAFDAMPPKNYNRTQRWTQNNPGLFTRSASAFDRFLNRLRVVPDEGPFQRILQSDDFCNFMVSQLNLPEYIVDYFREKYAGVTADHAAYGNKRVRC